MTGPRDYALIADGIETIMAIRRPRIDGGMGAQAQVVIPSPV